MSERLKIVTSLVIHPTITRLYKKKHGSRTCDMNGLIKLPCGCEIRPIYVQIWEEPSVCVGSINLRMQGGEWARGRRSSINRTCLHGRGAVASVSTQSITSTRIDSYRQGWRVIVPKWTLASKCLKMWSVFLSNNFLIINTEHRSYSFVHNYAAGYSDKALSSVFHCACW